MNKNPQKNNKKKIELNRVYKDPICNEICILRKHLAELMVGLNKMDHKNVING